MRKRVRRRDGVGASDHILRFRTSAKAHPCRCASFPQRNHFVGFRWGPRESGFKSIPHKPKKKRRSLSVSSFLVREAGLELRSASFSNFFVLKIVFLRSELMNFGISQSIELSNFKCVKGQIYGHSHSVKNFVFMIIFIR